MKSTRRLSFDQLELRDMTAVDFTDGFLRIVGDDLRNVIVLRRVRDGLSLSGSEKGLFQDVQSIHVDAAGGDDRVDFRGVVVPGEIEIHGGSGNDVILAATDKVFGGLGDDFFDDLRPKVQTSWDGGGGYDCKADKWTDGYSPSDSRQSARGTCGFLAVFNAWMAKGGRPQITYLGNMLYGVRVGNLSGRVTFAGFVYADAYSHTPEEFYPALVERLWMQQGYPWGSVWPDEAWHAITGRTSEVRYGYAGADFVQWARVGMQSGMAVFVATKEVGWVAPGLHQWHAYRLIREDRGGVWVFDPHGVIKWIGWYPLMNSINYASRGY